MSRPHLGAYAPNQRQFARRVVLAAWVLLAHAGLLWAALGSGALRLPERPPLTRLPEVVMATVVAAPAQPPALTRPEPAAAKPVPPPPQARAAVPKPELPAKAPAEPPKPTVAPVATPSLSSTLSVPASQATVTPAPVAPTIPASTERMASAVASRTTSPVPPAPAPKVQMPSSDAAYLHNRPPPYPALSKRLGEQGTVVIRVLIDAAGNASQAELHTSSGYDRLDRIALSTVATWRFVPGTVNGEPKAMRFNVPVEFTLD